MIIRSGIQVILRLLQQNLRAAVGIADERGLLSTSLRCPPVARYTYPVS
jgi:hypothetical protein